jgi:hypothetical protein
MSAQMFLSYTTETKAGCTFVCSLYMDVRTGQTLCHCKNFCGGIKIVLTWVNTIKSEACVTVGLVFATCGVRGQFSTQTTLMFKQGWNYILWEAISQN